MQQDNVMERSPYDSGLPRGVASSLSTQGIWGMPTTVDWGSGEHMSEGKKMLTFLGYYCLVHSTYGKDSLGSDSGAPT